MQPISLPYNPFAFERQHTLETLNTGGRQVPRVACHLPVCATPADIDAAGYQYVEESDKYNFSDIAADFVFLHTVPDFSLPGGVKPVYPYPIWRTLPDGVRNFPLFASPDEFLAANDRNPDLNLVRLTRETIASVTAQAGAWSQVVFVLDSPAPLPAWDYRALRFALLNAGIMAPVWATLRRVAAYGFYNDENLSAQVRMSRTAQDQLALTASVSTLLVDGLLDGLWLANADREMLTTAFNMLQLSRLRITKTEYISCPSCGRTLFDLQETTARIRKRTEHLKGVKIGIMGCIVNGPGEMADADYGYVGVGPDKIALYRGQEVVVKAVHPDNAVDALIGLIREDGCWVEPA